MQHHTLFARSPFRLFAGSLLTFTNWTLPGHIFAGKVTNSIQTVAGFSFMTSTGTGGAQNIALNAKAGPVLFKQLQESILMGFSPLSIGNQCGRGGNL
jgi:hypothetical protein